MDAVEIFLVASHELSLVTRTVVVRISCLIEDTRLILISENELTSVLSQ
jgi:hypothetical protein